MKPKIEIKCKCAAPEEGGKCPLCVQSYMRAFAPQQKCVLHKDLLPQPPTNWEEEFDKKVPPDENGYNHITHESIKSLIRSLLSKERAEAEKDIVEALYEARKQTTEDVRAKTLSQVIEICEGKKKEERVIMFHGYFDENMNYNQALDDLKAEISKLKKSNE